MQIKYIVRRFMHTDYAPSPKSINIWFVEILQLNVIQTPERLANFVIHDFV